MRSKTSEATSNLAGIRTGEEAFRAEHDVYKATTVGGVPGAGAASWPTAVPAASGVLWEDPNAAGGAVIETVGFKTIGFAADGVVRYSYQVTVIAPTAGPTPPYFTATATGNLDEDATNAVYVVSNDYGTPEARANAAGQTAPEVYPKAILAATGAGAPFDDF